MKYFDTEWRTRDGASLYAQGWEPEQKPVAVICMVHGLGEHFGRYHRLAKVLTDHGFTYIGIDLRGHGKTPGQRGYIPSFDVFMQDISLLLDQAGIRSPGLPKFLYGHSLGGILVLNYCLRKKPDLAGVIVTSPGLRNALEEQTAKIVFAKIAGAILPRLSLSTGLDANGLSRNPEVARAYLEDPLVHDRATLRMAKETLAAIPYVFENAADFRYPLLLMHGMADRLAYARGSQEFAALAIQAEIDLKLWDGAYHELHNEPEQDQVFEYLIHWLQMRVGLISGSE
jgi:alpha-beta hydrolase superfamily lysophospholipase